MKELLHAGDGKVGLTFVYSEKPCDAEIIFALWLEVSQCQVISFFDSQVGGEMGDQSGEELKFLVVGSLLLGVFECVQGLQEARGNLLFGDGMAPGCFGGAGELIDWEKIGVGMLDCGVLRELGGVDLADL